MCSDDKREIECEPTRILSLDDKLARERRAQAKELTAAREAAIRTARDVVSAVHERARRDIEVAQHCTLWLTVVGDITQPRDAAEVALNLPLSSPSPFYFPRSNAAAAASATTPLPEVLGLDAVISAIVAAEPIQRVRACLLFSLAAPHRGGRKSCRRSPPPPFSLFLSFFLSVFLDSQKLEALRAQASPFYAELRARDDPSLRVVDLEPVPDTAATAATATDASNLAHPECFALAADVLENTLYNIMCEAVLGETKLHVPPTIVYERIAEE